MSYEERKTLQVLSINNNDKILILAPHPDDECIGTGGILALFPELCNVIVLTDGRQGQGMISPEIEKEIRKKEFLNEMAAAGVHNYKMLDYEDGTLMQHTDCLIGEDMSVYTKIFVTGVNDRHADHTAACVSLLKALETQKLSEIEIYVYEVHVLLRDITHMLDITRVIDKKIALIQFHKSQLEGLAYDCLAKSMSEYRAIQNRMPGHFIETYQKISLQNDLENSTIELENKLQKSTLFYWVLTRWMDANLKGRRLAEVLRSQNYHCIAIYGYAELGKLLHSELSKDGFKVSYILDKKIENTEEDTTSVFSPKKGLPLVDAVVVTAVYYFEEIKNELMQLGFDNIISLRTLVEIITD